MGGVRYAILDRLVIYGGVRYFDAGSVNIDILESENSSFAVEAGVRIYF